MRTKQKDRDRPGPEEPWNEIVPGLWMGGHVWTDRTGELREAVVGAEFDLVASLYARPGHGPAPGVEHLYARMPDGRLTGDQLRAAEDLALAVARAVRSGRTVLVRCHSGYNRSGLVTARALVELGHPLPDAIDLIRRRRSPWALSTEVFVEYLGTGLGVAALLSELDPVA
ncbi:protein phosphatase [Kitasatospora sp. NPDC096147]|uniref:protein-tyrosine phosphatase family protein n=1 Tax=Kitasatospora sp. NPDC096147 TaxID=3364093 RepID=UPI00380DE164